MERYFCGLRVLCTLLFARAAYLQARQKTRLKRLFEARAVPLKHGVGVFAIFAGAQNRCHIVWLHVVFVCCKMYAQHLARNEAARFYLSTLRVFCFSLF